MRRRGLIRDIRDDYERETGERPSAAVADVILDRMLDAFFHAFEAEPVYAVTTRPVEAEYLRGRWTGEDRRRLVAAIKAAHPILDKSVVK